MRYRDDLPIPPGYEVVESPIRSMVMGGILAIGIPYVIGLSGALLADFKDQSAWLAVPVAGPWLMRGFRGSDGDRELRTILGVDGLVQGLGVILVGVGLNVTRKELVRTSFESAWVAPVGMGKGGYGIAAGAKF